MPPLTDQIGYWGNVTSTLDWCEGNYEVTRYIAEFWNTISNTAMIIPPIYSYVLTLKHGNMKMETRFLLSYLSILAVGFGSWLFHMTLLYEFQLFDEIPMVWGSLLLVYVLATIIFPHLDHSIVLIVGLIVYGIFVTTAYLYFIHPIIFQVSYGFLVAIILYMDFYISRNRPCDPKLFYLSAFLYYLGFFIWNIDNIYCQQITQFRNSLPFLIRPFTQLHSIWHVLAGYGSYIHIFYCSQARCLQKKYKVKWVWKYIGFYLKLDEENESLEEMKSK